MTIQEVSRPVLNALPRTAAQLVCPSAATCSVRAAAHTGAGSRTVVGWPEKPAPAVPAPSLEELIRGPQPPPEQWTYELLPKTKDTDPPAGIATTKKVGKLAQSWALPPVADRTVSTPPTRIEPGAVLQFAYGVEEPAWSIDSAPVTFEVVALFGEKQISLFRRVLDPARNESERRWFEQQISLDPVAGKSVQFRFSATTVDPADLRPQAPVWADPSSLEPRADTRPSIVLVSLDTLRARSLSAYGYEHETTPFLASLAKRGALFTRAFTTFSNTVGSHVSMFTGLYPASHQAIQLEKIIPPEVPNLAQSLRKAGYVTAAFTENGNVKGPSGFWRGFEYYNEFKRIIADGGGATGTFGRALDWVQHNRDRPFFLFVHTYAVHFPYVPPKKYAELLKQDASETIEPRRSLLNYEAEIRFLDDEVSRLIEGISKHVDPKHLLLVITSDHGEEFKEHGFLQHRQLYDEVLNVPLLFVWSDVIPAGERHGQAVSLVDIVPTVLDLASVSESASTEGQSLAPLLTGKATPSADRMVYAQGWPSVGRQFASRQQSKKCIIVDREPTAECFDLATDPDEKAPLPESSGPAFKRLATAVRAYRDQFYENAQNQTPTPASSQIDLERERNLRALGYIE